jgi:membrane-associated phospholipid phosphatase
VNFYFDRYEVPHDPDTSYPIMADTVTSFQLAILIIVIPIGTFLLATLIHRSLADLHHSLLSLLEGFAMVTLFKRWMNLVGRYRPIYQALVVEDNAAEIEDGRQSYPSGHAAYMFLAMTITSLYLLGRTRVLARPRAGNFAVAFFCITPIILATFVAVSRAANHKHHFSDINAGMFIGLATGLFAYLLNYESVLDPARAGLPKCRGVVPLWIEEARRDACSQGVAQIAAAAGIPETAVAETPEAAAAVTDGATPGVKRSDSRKGATLAPRSDEEHAW